VTEEVGDKPINYLLPSDMQVAELVGTQMFPEHRFGRRHRAPELARTLA
jgi:hypothetical protein